MKPDGNATISVIVPAYNAADTLAACLESLLSQTRPASEIIVVDDASGDETAAVASRYPVKLVRLHRNCGPGLARNAGADASFGGLLAFTDADCVAPPDWLERTAAALDAPGVVAATGGYAGPVRPGFLATLQHLFIRERQDALPVEIRSTITSNLVCRAAAFRTVGGFPRYCTRASPGQPVWGNEDEELGYLLSRVGTVRWLPEDGVFHEFRPRLAGFLRQQAFYAERIVVSHFRFPGMAAGASNYSRFSGLIHLLATLGVTFAAASLGACAALADDPLVRSADEISELACSAAAVLLAALLPVLALLPLKALGYLRRQGQSLAFTLKAYPILLAVDFAWLYGAVRGTLLSLGGFAECPAEACK